MLKTLLLFMWMLCLTLPAFATMPPAEVTMEHGAPPRGVYLSRDGTQLISRSGEMLRLWDTATGTLIHTMTAPDIGRGLWSPDEAYFLTYYPPYPPVYVWDIASGRQPFTLDHQIDVLSASWKPDSTQFILNQADGFARVYAVQTGDLIFQLDHRRAADPQPEEVMLGGWDQTGRYIITRSMDNLRVWVWDAATGKRLDYFGYSTGIASVQPSQDGNRLLISLQRGGLVIRNTVNGERSFEMMMNVDSRLLTAFWHADETQIIAGYEDGTLQQIDIATGTVLHTYAHGESIYWQIHTEGNDLFVISQQAISIWDMDTRQTIYQVSTTEYFYDVAWNGEKLASIEMLTGFSGTIFTVWDKASGQNVIHLPETNLVGAAWFPDGERLAIWEIDGTIKIIRP